MPRWKRRRFIGGLTAAGLWLPGCGSDEPGDDLGEDDLGGSGGDRCGPTEPNGEGPFYRPGAPMRTDLTDPEQPGLALTLTGRVLGPDCAPLAGATIDVWHADDQGRYDNDGSMPGLDPTVYLLRGQLQTDDDGLYRLRTMVPGHYMVGTTFRPAHLHVKVRGEGLPELTTQLYFEGDRYLASDSFSHEGLVLPFEDDQSGRQARFDFALG